MNSQDITLPFFEDYQVLPPFKNDTKFEEFIEDIFNDLENTTSYDRYGRTGQKQHGLDIFSEEKQTIIQCKLKFIDRPDDKIREELLSELEKDFNAFTIYNNSKGQAFTKFIFASTFKNDSIIHDACISKSTPKLKVEYWHWERILKYFKGPLKGKYFSTLISGVSDYYFQPSKKGKPQSIDLKKPIIEQLYSYFNISLKEIHKLPNHILSKSYPFRSSINNHSYYKKFNLTTNNKELFAFLGSLKISGSKIEFTDKLYIKGVSNYEKKTKKILGHLTSHLIYNIISDNENKWKEIKYSSGKKCNCVRCELTRLNFSKAFPLLIKKSVSIETQMKTAYANYKVGNFVTSAKMFLKISEKSKNNNLKVTHFICNYNLTKLKIFIRNNYWGKNAQNELLDQLEKIDLNPILLHQNNGQDRELVNWINGNNFYSESRDKIHELTTKIREHYESQLHGGWSSGSEVYELINVFAELDLFLNSNFIVYDKFSEFSELSKIFTEGIIASLAMNDLQNGKLFHLDDWLTQKILFYGNSESLLKYVRRYNLREIPYKKTSTKTESDGFLAIVATFLKNNSFEKDINKYCEPENRRFWSNYNTIFENIIVLSSLLNLNSLQVNSIIELVIPLVKRDKQLDIFNLSRLENFVRRKGDLISKQNLINLLITAVETGKLHGDTIIESIAETIEKHHGAIDLPNEVLDKVSLMSFEKCVTCSRQHSAEISVYIYRITKNSQRKLKIKESIENYLELTFDFNLFYLSAIWEIIPIKEPFLGKFINESMPSPQRASFREAFGGEKSEISYHINMLLNLCYKSGIDLTAEKFAPFKKINNYYNWLFDMQNFDYNLFKPAWINEYSTKYFFNEFRKYDIIKLKLVEYFKNNNDPITERTFMNIYHKWPN